MNLDYERDMQIDVDGLDVEWLDQPVLALRYGKYVSQLRAEVARLEERKKTTRAELIVEANKDPQGTCNKDKPNAADIEAYYRTSERYKDVIKDLLKAQEELEYAEVAKNEISFTRKAALENLVRLHGQQYFAGPRVPRDLGKEWESRQRQKQSNSAVARGMKRGRKNHDE